MVRSSYSDVFSISHEREFDEHIEAGDLVRTGPNMFPHYTVIAVCGDKVWVRDEQYGSDGITNLNLSAARSTARRQRPELTTA